MLDIEEGVIFRNMTVFSTCDQSRFSQCFDFNDSIDLPNTIIKPLDSKKTYFDRQDI